MKTPSPNPDKEELDFSGSKSPAQEWLVYAEAFSHPDFKIEKNWTISIKDPKARSDEPSRKMISIESCVLPSTSLYPKSIKLSERPDLAISCLLASEAFYAELKVLTKSSLSNTARIARTTAKYFEYCWLEGFYDPKTITDESLTKLDSLLKEGGWIAALSIPKRLDGYLMGKTYTQTDKGLFHIEGDPPITGTTLLKLLGTNVTAYEARILFDEFSTSASNNLDEKFKKHLKDGLNKPSRSALIQYYIDVNLLFQIPPPFNIPKYPFPFVSHAFDVKDGSRTQNLKVEQVAHLLSRAVLWIDKIGPIVCEAVEAIAEDVIVRKDANQLLLGWGIPKVLEGLNKKLQKIDSALIVTNGDMARNKGVSIAMRDLIMAIQCACFVMIAGMNARRKDEIIDRRIGLNRYSMTVEDEELKIYQTYFYIEKSFNDYMPYYVNDGTYRAIRILERLHDSYEKIDQKLTSKIHSSLRKKEATLFCYRRFSMQKGIGLRDTWFEINSALRIGVFQLYAGDFDENFRFRSHTLRRFYSILFYYRYENATLHSLMYQLGHRHLTSTFTYITDPVSRQEVQSISNAIDAAKTDRKKAFDVECNGLLKDMNDVGKDKLYENIRLILNGNASGGYATYIRKLDAKLATVVKGAEKNINSRVDRVVNRVLAAGHWPDPKPHGDCMAGGQSSWKLARCGDKEGKLLRQELASPIKCATCPFHHVSEGYLNHMIDDLAKLRHSVKKGNLSALERNSVLREIENLSIAIGMHSDRLHQ